MSTLDSAEFSRLAMSLGCPVKAATAILRMANRLQQSCLSVTMDDLLTLSLEMIPRALNTHRADRQASVTTHIVTVVRNACVSLLSKERQHASREMNTIHEQPDGLFTHSPFLQAAYQDRLDLLEQILSPYAWRMFVLIRRSVPASLSGRAVGEQLDLSATSVHHLRDEIRAAVSAVFDCSGGVKRKK